jgi:prepilin-type N-terminal cleavage/methylation domain-containing protein
MRCVRKQPGFTLIELMVGLTLGLMVTSALFWIYVGNIRTTTDSVRAARLNNDLRAAMELMVSDIRRAGYWEGVVDDSVSPPVVTNLFTTGNPFMDPAEGTDIAVGKLGASEPDDSCISYTYDANQDGAVTLATTPKEGYGFRLNAGEVEMRTGGSISPGNLGCGSGAWEPITDANFVNVTGLTFRVEGAAGEPSSSCQNLSDPSCGGDGIAANSCGDDTVTRCCWRSLCSDSAASGYTAPGSGDRLIETRLVAITLTGQAADDAAVTKTLTEFVKVRNDRAFVAP